jgi:hypothetical protein
VLGRWRVYKHSSGKAALDVVKWAGPNSQVGVYCHALEAAPQSGH